MADIATNETHELISSDKVEGLPYMIETATSWAPSRM